MTDSITKFSPLLISLLIWGAILWVAHSTLIARQPELGSERKFPRQLVLLGLTIVSIVATILVLPVSESSRNQLLGLIGLLLSGMVAFSSTTIVSNLMAGLLLRITKPFKIGDFVNVGEHFGRVSERGLFDTEIQTESRELVSLPNTYFIRNPVTATRKSGAIISQTLSLGYEFDHSHIESLLVKAAENTGLSEPFVQIIKLGDFSVTYRVAGFLTEVRQLITARSNLCCCILDILHQAGIEIVSPTYMNQRRLENDAKVVPKVTKKVIVGEEAAVNSDDIVFDKAERAEKIEARKEQLNNDIKQLEEILENKSEQQAADDIKEQIQQKTTLLVNLEM